MSELTKLRTELADLRLDLEQLHAELVEARAEPQRLREELAEALTMLANLATAASSVVASVDPAELRRNRGVMSLVPKGRLRVLAAQLAELEA